jgi:pimeloyl-ACP methyl ester carboxylesterase
MKKTGFIVSKITLTIFLILVVIVLSVLFSEYYKVANAPYYDADEMELSYEIIGNGNKNLILLHGLAGSKNYWKYELDEITKTHTLLLIDLLGFGDSPKPYSNYNLITQLESIEKIITKEGFNKGEAVLVGHSMGAILSLSMYAKYPNWFKGATVIGLPVITNKKQFIQNMAANSYFDKLAVSKYGKLFCMFHPLYTTKWFQPKNLTNEVFSDAKKHTWQSYYYSLNELIFKTDLYAVTQNIKNQKILFIQGEKDYVTPLIEVEKFAKTFSKAKFIEIKNGDHQLFLKDSKRVWELISLNF